MIRLKTILLEQLSDDDLRNMLVSDRKIINKQFLDLLRFHGVAEYIANQFAESIDTSKTEYANPMGGAFSKVYWLKSGKILKITNNANEAETGAYYSKRRKHPHIISYYDVREIVFNGQPLSDPYWAMITDGVRTLTRQETYWYEDLLDETGFLEARWVDSTVESELADMGYLGWNPDQEKHLNQDRVQWFRNMLKQRQAILRDIKAFQVASYEAHSNNVGFDEHGQFVIFDIWSQSAKTNTGIARRMQNSIDIAGALRPKYTTDGIDTPNNPDM
jgi:hypothetical protein